LLHGFMKGAAGLEQPRAMRRVSSSSLHVDR
jgi:hypothetical protein